MTQFSRNIKADYSSADSHASQAAQAAGLDQPRRNVLLSLWHHRWIVLGTMLLALIVAAIHLYRAPRIYEAAARLTVERSGPRIVANDPSEIMGQAQNFLNTQCQVLMSHSILQVLAEDPGISSMKTFEGNTDRVVYYLKGSVLAKVEPKNDIIRVAVRSPVGPEAATLANAIVDSYKAELEKQKRSSIKQIIEFYTKEKLKTEQQLVTAREKKLKFQKDYADLALGSQHSSPVYERLARLQSALTEVELVVLNTQAAYDATLAMSSDPQKIRQLLDSRQFKSENADLRRQMRKLQQRFAMVGKTYLPNFPDVGLLQQAIKQLEQEMQQEDKKVFDAYVAELDARLVTEKNNQAQLQLKYNEAKSQWQALYSRAAEFSIIQAESEGLEKYNSDLGMRIRELSPLSDDVMVNVNVIENARASDVQQVEPNVAMTMYLALLGGGFLGALLAVGRDLLDQRLRSAEEIKQVTGLPLLGVVPHIQQTGTPTSRALFLHTEPMSDVAESYRTVRTAVYFGTPAGTAKTMLITSPSPGEGKSTLASNLAIAMAQAGNRILLLDADFRKPIQHKFFEIDRSVGLSQVLAGNQTLDEAICPTPVPGLDLLPCGPIPANPSEILNSQMFADVLEELSQRYDHVLVDSPPVVPVTDARILAASCDATVLAVRAEKTARKAAIFTRDTLRSVGARLLGVVVNDVPRRKGLYGYYYSDSQLYQYGYGTPTRARSELTATPTANGNGERAAVNTESKQGAAK